MPAFRAVTFDCFGTLIDWRRGQERVLECLPSLRGHAGSIPAILDARGPIEMRMETGTWRSYASILADSIAEACRETAGVELTDAERRAFAAGQLGWPAFEDTPAALARLAGEIPVGLLSNCDARILRHCARKHLGAEVAFFVSAEEVRSYKPAAAHWRKALEITALQPGEILHVSFTPEYDLQPAHALGFPLGFIGRYGARPPAALPLAAEGADLTALVETLLG